MTEPFNAECNFNDDGDLEGNDDDIGALGSILSWDDEGEDVDVEEHNAATKAHDAEQAQPQSVPVNQVATAAPNNNSNVTTKTATVAENTSNGQIAIAPAPSLATMTNVGNMYNPQQQPQQQNFSNNQQSSATAQLYSQLQPYTVFNGNLIANVGNTHPQQPQNPYAQLMTPQQPQNPPNTQSAQPNTTQQTTQPQYGIYQPTNAQPQPSTQMAPPQATPTPIAAYHTASPQQQPQPQYTSQFTPQSQPQTMSLPPAATSQFPSNNNYIQPTNTSGFGIQCEPSSQTQSDMLRYLIANQQQQQQQQPMPIMYNQNSTTNPTTSTAGQMVYNPNMVNANLNLFQSCDSSVAAAEAAKAVAASAARAIGNCGEAPKAKRGRPPSANPKRKQRVAKKSESLAAEAAAAVNSTLHANNNKNKNNTNEEVSGLNCPKMSDKKSANIEPNHSLDASNSCAEQSVVQLNTGTSSSVPIVSHDELSSSCEGTKLPAITNSNPNITSSIITSDTEAEDTKNSMDASDNRIASAAKRLGLDNDRHDDDKHGSDTTSNSNNGITTSQSGTALCSGSSIPQHLSAAEKAKVNRDRNREHARNTRLRKKAYLEKLKITVDDLCKERDSLVHDRATAAMKLVEQHRIRMDVLFSFFALRQNNGSDGLWKRRECWSGILEEGCFTCVTPVTPYRSFPASEVQVSKCQRTILGIDAIMSDTASLHVLLNSLIDYKNLPQNLPLADVNSAGRPQSPPRITFQYTLITEDAVSAGNQLMARWKMNTLNAVAHGAHQEISKQGMLYAKFNSCHKIISLEFMFDVMAFMLQLKQATGEANFRIIPNTVQTAQRYYDMPMCMTLAERPYTIVQVNKLWEDMTGYKANEVVGKTNCRILQHNPNSSASKVNSTQSAIDELMMNIRYKRPATTTLLNYDREGNEFSHVLQVFPLSTDSKITHYVGLSLFCKKISRLAVACPASDVSGNNSLTGNSKIKGSGNKTLTWAAGDSGSSCSTANSRTTTGSRSSGGSRNTNQSSVSDVTNPDGNDANEDNDSQGNKKKATKKRKWKKDLIVV